MKIYYLFILVFLCCGTIIRAQNITPVQAAFMRSYANEKNKDYIKAAEELKKVYSADSYEQNLRLGWLLFNALKLDESVSYYTKAIELKPKSIEPRLGIVYPLSTQQKWDDVLKHYNAILLIEPNNTLVNYYTGLIYYNTSKFNEALKCFNTFLGLYPFDYDAVIMSAWTNLKLGKKEEAKMLFQRTLLYNPGDVSALEGIAAAK